MTGRIYLAGLAIAILALAFFIFYNLSGEPTGLLVSKPGERLVLEPAAAGTFYPSYSKKLSSTIEKYLSDASLPDIPAPRGLVAPHAGYVYSGPTAAYGFKALSGREYETVIVIGPSHYFLFEGAVVPNATHYKTPLGEARISPKTRELAQSDMIFMTNKAFEPEHSVEVEIPFLQTVLDDFELIPIITSRTEPRELASALLAIVDDKTLVVASSDLSHYHPYDIAVAMDTNCTEGIPELDFDKLKKCEACGIVPIMTLMYLAQEKGWKGRLLNYRNSGDTSGLRGSVVGYAAVAFYEEAP